MGSTGLLHLICLVIALVSVSLVQAEDAYKYFTWTVTYGTLYPLASPQQVCKCNQSVFVIVLFVLQVLWVTLLRGHQ